MLVCYVSLLFISGGLRINDSIVDAILTDAFLLSCSRMPEVSVTIFITDTIGDDI